MPIPTDKPLKKCKYCGKEFANLAAHIINNHPNIIEQLEENFNSQSLPAAPLTPTKTINSGSVVGSDTSSMVKEKLETMLNIKLIQMLEKGASIEEMQRIINPQPQQQPLGLKEIKEFHDLVYKENVPTESGANWADVLLAAAPILSEMIPKRKNTESVKNEFRSNQDGDLSILKPIQDETSRDTEQSGGFGEKSGVIGETKQ